MREAPGQVVLVDFPDRIEAGSVALDASLQIFFQLRPDFSPVDLLVRAIGDGNAVLELLPLQVVESRSAESAHVILRQEI